MSPSDDRNSPWARIAGSQSIAVGDEVERDPAHRGDRDPEEEPSLLGLPSQRAGEPSAPIRRRRRRPGVERGIRAALVVDQFELRFCAHISHAAALPRFSKAN